MEVDVLMLMLAAEFNLDLSKLVPWKGIDCEAEPDDPLWY